MSKARSDVTSGQFKAYYFFPPNVDQSVLLRSYPIPKGRETGRGRQAMQNISQRRPGLTG